MPFVQERLKALDEYIESHDNLIKKIYEKELTILPTRLSTLEFYKVGEKEMSELARNNI